MKKNLSPCGHGGCPSGFVEPEVVRIAEGWFLMGSESGQSNERPVHRVWLEEFLIAAYQVTNSDYAVFLAATKHPLPPFWGKSPFNHPQQPVVAVSWSDAVAYCEWLTEITFRRYRLPTEAEWERAARGGFEAKLYPWGDESPQSLPDYNSRWQSAPERVGHSRPNGYGLYDICTNIHEWCADWYDADYYRFSPERSPLGPAAGTRRASRGGSWRHQIKASRCAARSSIPPAFQYADYGFRVAAGTEKVEKAAAETRG